MILKQINAKTALSKGGFLMRNILKTETFQRVQKHILNADWNIFKNPERFIGHSNKEKI